MTDFTPATRPSEASEEPLLDSFLREALPEVKLALGDLIDRDNSRAIPEKYVKMLPLTTLVVTLRPDAAQAVADMAADLEQDLSDSVMRHGSLYDRDYQVRLKEAGSRTAPLFRVGVQPAGQPDPEPIIAAPPPAPAPPAHRPHAPEPRAEAEPTIAAPMARPAAPAQPSWSVVPPPSADADATRVEGLQPAPRTDFPAGRFALVVPNEDGSERERFPLTAPRTSVGRQTDDASSRSDVQLTDSKSVSRRQLVLVWAERDGRRGFDVFNLGLNGIHVGGREVPGSNSGKGPLKLDGLDAHRVWVEPGQDIRIGGHGPIVRIEETEKAAGGGSAEEPVFEDPDKTQFG